MKHHNLKIKKMLSQFIFLSLLLITSIVMISCKKNSEEISETSFEATIVSLDYDTLLVRPNEDTKENQLCTQIYVPVDTNIISQDGTELDINDLMSASNVKITYDGILDNSDPAQIKNVYQIMILQ